MELTCKWITLVSRYYYMYLNDSLEPYGINASQYLYIIVVCREPGITQDKLPERIGINKSNVTRCLSQLEKSGFIYRICSSRDKRTAHVQPTEKAYALYPKIMRAVEKWDAHVTRLLSDTEKMDFQNTLKLLAESACSLVRRR